MSQQGMRVFSTAFKEAAVVRLAAGERLAAVARELGIARKLLYEWRAAHRRFGVAGLNRRRGPKPRSARASPDAAPGRVGAKDCSLAPLTEPDMRASHPALWIDISEVQRELNRNLRWMKVVPHSFERGHPSGEPCR